MMGIVRELGGFTVTEFLKRVSTHELLFWLAFFKLENERDSQNDLNKKGKAHLVQRQAMLRTR